ncbi:TPA: EAL domain-containing protein [Photobacterium damselae]
MLFGLFIFIFAIAGYSQFNEVKQLLNEQLQTELEYTAQNLSITLIPALETGDLNSQKKLISGFSNQNIKEIILTGAVDGHISQWHDAISFNQVPSWFLSLSSFSDLHKEIIIKSGWLELAKLEIVINPTKSYTYLWHYFLYMLGVFIGIVVASLLILKITFYRLLKPIDEVTQKAQKIVHREYNSPLACTKIIELKPLIDSINQMGIQLNKYFELMQEEIGVLRKIKQIDTISQLPNQEYFRDRLHSWLEEPTSGSLMVLRCSWLEKIKQQYGTHVYQESIKILSGYLSSCECNDLLVAKAEHDDFWLLVSDKRYEQQQLVLRNVIQIVNKELENHGMALNQDFAIGAVFRDQQKDVQVLLDEAYDALQLATETRCIYAWLNQIDDNQEEYQYWKQILDKTFADHDFILRGQPVHYLKQQGCYHQEIFCQIEVCHDRVMAHKFMPYIELFEMGVFLDKAILIQLEQYNTDIWLTGNTYTVNLTVDSIRSLEFRLWLADYLETSKHTCQLMFEIPEAAIISNIDACYDLALLLAQYQISWGVDHYGRQLSSVEYLEKLNPNYVKLDQSFRNLSPDSTKYELRRALINTANSLNINVIATGIQCVEELRDLNGSHIFAYQGFIAPPQDLIS